LVARGEDSTNCLSVARWVLDQDSDMVHDEFAGHDQYDRELPLHTAIRMQQAASVQLLLEYGAKPLYVTKHRRTPLSVAIRTGHLPITRILYLHIVEREHSLKSRQLLHGHMLYHAISSKTSVVLDWMFDVLRVSPMVPCHRVIQDWMFDILPATMEIPSNKKGHRAQYAKTAISVALKKQKTYAIRRLVELGVDVQITDKTKKWLRDVVLTARPVAVRTEIQHRLPGHVESIVSAYLG
jgi:hypothetical protein